MQHFNSGMLTLARESRDLTQAELARESGVAQAIISRLEGGIAQPSGDSLSALADHLRYPADFFFEDAGVIVVSHGFGSTRTTL